MESRVFRKWIKMSFVNERWEFRGENARWVISINDTVLKLNFCFLIRVILFFTVSIIDLLLKFIALKWFIRYQQVGICWCYTWFGVSCTALDLKGMIKTKTQNKAKKQILSACWDAISSVADIVDDDDVAKDEQTSRACAHACVCACVRTCVGHLISWLHVPLGDSVKAGVSNSFQMRRLPRLQILFCSNDYPWSRVWPQASSSRYLVLCCICSPYVWH